MTSTNNCKRCHQDYIPSVHEGNDCPCKLYHIANLTYLDKDGIPEYYSEHWSKDKHLELILKKFLRFEYLDELRGGFGIEPGETYTIEIKEDGISGKIYKFEMDMVVEPHFNLKPIPLVE